MHTLSPTITPVKYERPELHEMFPVTQVEYTYDGIEKSKKGNNPKVTAVDDDMLRYYGEDFELYITDVGVHVPESVYRSTKMIPLREHVLNVLAELADDGIVTGLRQVDEYYVRQ